MTVYPHGNPEVIKFAWSYKKLIIQKYPPVVIQHTYTVYGHFSRLTKIILLANNKQKHIMWVGHTLLLTA